MNRWSIPNNFTTMSNFKMKWILKELEFPFTKDGEKVGKLERQNNISMIVYGFETVLFPVYVTKERFNTHLNFLLYYQWTTNHWCLNKDLSKLLHDQNLQKIRRYYCRYCLHGFIREDVFRDHLTQCCQHGRSALNSGTKITPHFSWMATTSNWKYHFVMYAHF